MTALPGLRQALTHIGQILAVTAATTAAGLALGALHAAAAWLARPWRRVTAPHAGRHCPATPAPDAPAQASRPGDPPFTPMGGAVRAGATPTVRECARCGHVLVDEDEQGWYYQTNVTDPEFPGLTFMDRVHECDGKPHDVRTRATPQTPAPAIADGPGQAQDLPCPAPFGCPACDHLSPCPNETPAPSPRKGQDEAAPLCDLPDGAATLPLRAVAPVPPQGQHPYELRGDWKETRGLAVLLDPLSPVRPWALFDGPITVARCAAWIAARDYRQAGWIA